MDDRSNGTLMKNAENYLDLAKSSDTYEWMLIEVKNAINQLNLLIDAREPNK